MKTIFDKKNKLKTNKEIDILLEGKNIKRIDDYIGARVPINFQCLAECCGYIWKTVAYSITSANTGCPKCCGHIPYTLEEFIEKSIKKHGNKYGFSKFIMCQNNKIKGIIICPEHGEYLQSPQQHLRGYGCPKCGRVAAILNTRLTNDEFDLALKKKNKNIKRASDYIDGITAINFKCLVVGCDYIWRAMPDNILHTVRGCPKCAHRVPLEKEYVIKTLATKNINLLSEHIDTQHKSDLKCTACNHIWRNKIANILGKKNSGCPNCNRPGLNEKIIHRLLSENNISYYGNYYLKYINKICDRKFSVDFYFPELNLIVEYNGSQHYGPVKFGSTMSKETAELNFTKQQLRDKYVEEFCKENNIELIWIDGRKLKYNNLENYIITGLIPNKIKKAA
jgi:hypothetical protein